MPIKCENPVASNSLRVTLVMVRVKINVGITVASEDTCTLAKFQPMHELLHSRCRCHGGCRNATEQEMKGAQDSLDDHRIHTIIIEITMYTTS